VLVSKSTTAPTEHGDLFEEGRSKVGEHEKDGAECDTIPTSVKIVIALHANQGISLKKSCTKL